MKKKYVPPAVSVVRMNPEQAVLSVCSTTSKNNKATGNGTRCRSDHCKKRENSGDSMGRS